MHLYLLHVASTNSRSDAVLSLGPWQYQYVRLLLLITSVLSELALGMNSVDLVYHFPNSSGSRQALKNSFAFDKQSCQKSLFL